MRTERSNHVRAPQRADKAERTKARPSLRPGFSFMAFAASPGLLHVGLINPHQVVVRAVVMVSLPSSCLSFFRRVEEALASTVRGFFYK